MLLHESECSPSNLTQGRFALTQVFKIFVDICWNVGLFLGFFNAGLLGGSGEGLLFLLLRGEQTFNFSFVLAGQMRDVGVRLLEVKASLRGSRSCFFGHALRL